jgi:hypothetical protein
MGMLRQSSPTPGEDEMLDAWLRHELAQRHGSALQEEIPDQLIAVVDDHCKSSYWSPSEQTADISRGTEGDRFNRHVASQTGPRHGAAGDGSAKSTGR